MQIFEHEELKEYLDALEPKEFETLKASIKSDGVRDSLIVWNDFDAKKHWLVDGYHRKAIAEDLNIDYQTKIVYFEDLDEAKEWMILNQTGRRGGSESISSYHTSELVRIRTDRAKHKEQQAARQEIIDSVVTDTQKSKATIYRDLSKVKMGYENKLPERDEFDQSNDYDEFNQSNDFDEFDQSQNFDDMSQETPSFEHQAEGKDYVVDEYSQVATRGSGQRKPRKAKRPSVASQQKKCLRSVSEALSKLQNGIYEAERLFDNIEATAIGGINFRKWFEGVEILREQIVEKKGKFGKR